jgi:hypothetical protein
MFWMAALVVVLLGSLALATIRIQRQRLREWNSLDQEGVERGLRLLLKRGYDGAFAIVTEPTTQRFIQFRKFIGPSGTMGIQMHFPRAPWSEPFYSDISELVQRRGVSAQRTVVQGTPVAEFLEADFGVDVALAAAVVDDVLTHIFKTPKAPLQFRADDICPHDATVDRNDYPRPSVNLERVPRGPRPS